MKTLTALGCCAFWISSHASAMVIDGKILEQDGTGTFIKLETTTPFAVGADNFNDDHLYAFDEDQNILLESPVRVDIGGLNSRIASGTVVASHYVFYDSNSHILRPQFGYVDFDAPIIGIAIFQDTMAATDFLANTSVRYISTELRGLEDGDYVKVDKDAPHRLWVRWAASTPGDYIRVFTQLSPNALALPNTISKR